jgi:mRNA interferase RelE/StbE
VASYRILIKASAGKELAEVGSKADREKLVARIRELATSSRPRRSEKLAGYADRYRIRQGNYRVIYLIDDEVSVVTIFKIGHRRDVRLQMKGRHEYDTRPG